ncbi:MAG: hypothetical protein QM692_18885 [Thermomicrobiales bacterium]
MTTPMDVALEAGPKGKRIVAYAPDWPGLERGAKTEEAALERLQAYRPRYAPVAALAGMTDEFAASGALDITDRYPGTGSTDFWGISFAFSPHDQQPMTEAELERELALMQASWAFFDDVRGRVSPALRRGPRGGGKDRDQIVWHTTATEMDWGKSLGLPGMPDAMPDEAALQQHRADYVAAFREFHAQGKRAGKSPLRFLIRHTAFHTLDHAWEMEDKDLTGEQG